MHGSGLAVEGAIPSPTILVLAGARPAPTMVVLGGLEGDWQASDHEDDPGVDRNREVFHALEAFELFQHHGQGELGFQTRQWSADAEVDAVTKRQVTSGLTLDIKPVWIAEL